MLVGVADQRLLKSGVSFDATERSAAALLLILVSPILLPAALVIALLARRTPLVAIRRVGQHGRTFWMLKLRTMWDAGMPARSGDAIEYLSDCSVPSRKNGSDPRVTSVFAAFCRKFSLDELPQLWHVAKGEMSFVGPRPLTIRELADYYAEDAREVLNYKPGLTGLWQVCGRNRLTYSQRRRLDLFLVRHESPGLYWYLVARTIPSVLSGRDAC